MKRTSVLSKMTASLIAGVVLTSASLPAAAGVEGDPDHLKCYQVKDSLRSSSFRWRQALQLWRTG